MSEATALGQGYYRVYLEDSRFLADQEAAARARYDAIRLDPSRLYDFTFNRNANGLWQVWTQQSQHTAEREALETADALEDEDPSRVTRIDHDYDVDVENRTPSINLKQGEVGKMRLVSSCGACIKFEGEVTYTVMADTDSVQIWPEPVTP